ncbi:leukosialin [Apodemus sylvaticus]|uniref:leukosialin n=1 Tax=Apodemus sylvaticus TaxID=10129 RepID=UPI0022429DF3|nr:leukosialin [Apodemus sylvaticus]
MALLLLLFGGFWAQVVSLEILQNTTVLTSTPRIKHPEALSTSEALSANSSMYIGPVTVDPKDSINPRKQTPIPVSSTPMETTAELSSSGTSAGDSMNTPVTEPTTPQEVFSKTSVPLPEPSNVASDPPVTVANLTTDRTVTSTSLETSKGTSANVASDPPVTVANLTTDRTVASTSLETSKGTSAPPVTVTTSSEETSASSVATTVSSETSGPPVTVATGSLGPSNETHRLPATVATSFVESSSVAHVIPVSSIEILTTSTPAPITTRSPRRRSGGTLLVPMLIALIVVVALMTLLLLWRQRQKRRTGALTLSRGGKRNGVVDAWAGPARVPDEEATTASGVGDNKGSGVPETEGSGQRPTLTTFFSRRKSRQGSLVLEELKPGSGPNLKGEEEPLVGSEDEAVETPTSDGPQAKDEAGPQSL